MKQTITSVQLLTRFTPMFRGTMLSRILTVNRTPGLKAIEWDSIGASVILKFDKNERMMLPASACAIISLVQDNTGKGRGKYGRAA